MAALPNIIPIFPLPNLVLFPGLSVPLHIFEPRYREMIADVADAHGIIGMALLKGDWEGDYHAFPDIFEIGCAGKIGGLVKLADGRYNLTLEGLGEFRIAREIRERSYRQAEVTWCPVRPDALDCDAETMDALREMLFSYLGAAAQEAWRTIVEQRGLRGAEDLGGVQAGKDPAAPSDRSAHSVDDHRGTHQDHLPIDGTRYWPMVRPDERVYCT